MERFSLKRWVFSLRLNVDNISAVLTEQCRCDGRGVPDVQRYRSVEVWPVCRV